MPPRKRVRQQQRSDENTDAQKEPIWVVFRYNRSATEFYAAPALAAAPQPGEAWKAHLGVVNAAGYPDLHGSVELLVPPELVLQDKEFEEEKALLALAVCLSQGERPVSVFTKAGEAVEQAVRLRQPEVVGILLVPATEKQTLAARKLPLY